MYEMCRCQENTYEMEREAESLNLAKFWKPKSSLQTSALELKTCTGILAYRIIDVLRQYYELRIVEEVNDTEHAKSRHQC